MGLAQLRKITSTYPREYMQQTITYRRLYSSSKPIRETMAENENPRTHVGLERILVYMPLLYL